MRKTFIRGAVVAAIASATLVAPAAASGPMFHGPAKLPRYMTHPCPLEDSTNCYWDARTAGNGRGWSFYAIPVGRHRVAVVYWDHPRASFVIGSGR